MCPQEPRQPTELAAGEERPRSTWAVWGSGQRAWGHRLFGGSYGGRSPGAPPLPPTPPGCPNPNAAVSARLLPAGVVAFRFCSPRGYPGEVQKRAAPLPPRHGGYAPKCAGGLLAQPARILGLKSFGCCCCESGAAPPARGCCCCSPPAPRSRPRRQELLLGAGCEDSPAAACRWDLPALPPFLHFRTTRCLS